MPLSLTQQPIEFMEKRKSGSPIKKCLELMKNGQELEKAGLRGKEAVNRLFSPQRVKEKLKVLYGTVTA